MWGPLGQERVTVGPPEHVALIVGLLGQVTVNLGSPGILEG